MAKIEVYCIEKHRDRNGAITEYVMGDKLGDTMTFDRKGVIKLIKDKKYDVVNLQIDAAGRVVDKEYKNDAQIKAIQNKSKATDINTVFDIAYGSLMKMGLLMLIHNPNGSVVMTEPFDRLKGITDIEKLGQQFENYVMSKYNTKMLKIDSLNNQTHRRYICYGIGYVEDYPCEEEIRDAISVKSYTLKCSAPAGKKVVGPKKSKQGVVIEDAYIGAVAYDPNNAEAVDWAKKRVAELEKYLLKRPANGNVTVKANVNNGGNQGQRKVNLNKSEPVNEYKIRGKSNIPVIGKVIDFFRARLGF